MINSAQFLIESQHVRIEVLRLAVARGFAGGEGLLSFNSINYVAQKWSRIRLVQYMLISLEAEHVDHFSLREDLLRDA